MFAASSRRFPRLWLVAVLLLLVAVGLIIRSNASQLFFSPPSVRALAGVPLRVVDEQGKPVAAFNVQAVLNIDNGSLQYARNGRNGQTDLTGPARNQLDLHRSDLRTVDLAVEAAGFAPALVHFEGHQLEQLRVGEAEIELQPGQEVEIALRLPPGMDWPAEGRPSLYFDRLKQNVRHSWSIREDSQSKPTQAEVNQLGAVWAEPGLAKLRLTADSAALRVAVNIPGFLRLFETPSLTLSDFQEGRLEIDIPRPASLSVQFDPGDAPPEELLFDRADMKVSWPIGEEAVNFRVQERIASAPWLPLELNDLAPRNYRVMIRTAPLPDVADLPTEARPPLNPGKFTQIETFALTAGERKTIRAAYEPLDLDAFRGDRTAVLHVLKPDGSPAVGETIQVAYCAEHYNGLPVFSGAVPDSGTLSIDKITAHAPTVTDEPYTVWHKTAQVPGNRMLGQIGQFGFSSADGPEEFTFTLAPDEGDPAPDVELINVGSGEQVRLSDFRGRLVLLEFWATWCGPCQEPVRELNRWIVERQAQWKGRVAILPVSIDEDVDALRGHLVRNAWDERNFYWSGPGDWMAPAAKAFVVPRVPTTVLIAPDGRILLRDPSKRALEAAIAKALTD